MSKQNVLEDNHSAASLPDAGWYRALTLAERLDSLRLQPGTPTEGTINAALAQRRLQRWRSQAPFTTDSYFAQRLATEDITEEHLTRLFGEPITTVQARCPHTPDWLKQLAQALDRSCGDQPVPIPNELRGQDMIEFLEVIEPLLHQGRDRVRDGVRLLAQTHAELPFDPETVVDILFAHLPGLMGMLSPTLTLELHVARLQGLLQGETPRERFESFLARLRSRDNLRTFLGEYPVLARHVIRRIDNWVAFSLEFLQHLCADWAALRSQFSPDADPGPLVHVDGGLGDPHHGNRSVLLAHFRSGFRLVYKPRSLAVDVHFQELLAWLNERGNLPGFRILKILNRNTYGWVEFIDAKACTTAEELGRFSWRQGAYLAILYALEATDFHFENLIAAGEHPMLIDLEALFHVREKVLDASSADLLSGDPLAPSVLRVGLLPMRLFSEQTPEGIDLSGMGGESGQLTPGPVPSWEDIGTDDMRLVRKREIMHGGKHRPTLEDGQPVNPQQFAAEIEAGFTTFYLLLQQHREELLAPNGPLARFADDEVRVILRPTRIYGTLLHEAIHPDLMRDALDRDRFFDRLWVGVKTRPDLAKVVRAEHADLHQGDIPVFTTRPGSRDLWHGSNERVADFFEVTGMDLVQQRFKQMGDEDLTQQLWFIRASLSTPTPPRRQGGKACTNPLAAARAIGDRLEAQALRTSQGVGWMGLTGFGGQRQWAVQPLGVSLYDGLPGIALFLAYLGKVTGEERYTTLAQDTLAGIRRQVRRGLPSLTSVGAFGGWGGLIYTYVHLASLWQQPALLQEAEAIVELLPLLIDQDEQLDVILGVAGCIGSLLTLYRSSPSPRTLDVAAQCGERLLAKALKMDHGLAWPTPIPSLKPMIGFAHGVAGMAWALGHLGAATGNERFLTAARAGIAYERSLFSAETGNWPDLRDRKTLGLATHEATHDMVAWCQGAPGIGLARLHSLPCLGDAPMRSEIDAALKTTLARGFTTNGAMNNHSLCHGDLGNLDLLLEASEILGEPHWRVEAERLASSILASVGGEGWLCGVPAQLETPGLLTGLAGIGYEMLRLAEPAHLPSILALAGPG